MRVLDALLKARLALTKSCVAELAPCFHFVRADPANSVQEIRSNHDAKLRSAAEALVKTSHVVPMVFAKEFRFESYITDRPQRVPAAAVSDRVSMRRSLDGGSADPAPWDRRRSSIGSGKGDFLDQMSFEPGNGQHEGPPAPAPRGPLPAPPTRANEEGAADDDQALCLYDFEAESHFELTIFEGETVRVLALHDPTGNDEWVHIQNDSGAKGYVPKGFLEL